MIVSGQNNPDATYFDIKEQFDSIPTYEDGKGKNHKQSRFTTRI